MLVELCLGAYKKEHVFMDWVMEIKNRASSQYVISLGYYLMRSSLMWEGGPYFDHFLPSPTSDHSMKIFVSEHYCRKPLK